MVHYEIATTIWPYGLQMHIEHRFRNSTLIYLNYLVESVSYES